MFESLKNYDWKTFFWNRAKTIVIAVMIVIILACFFGGMYLFFQLVAFMIDQYPTIFAFIFFGGILMTISEMVRRDLE